jgi:hypothetical protein
LRPTTALSPRGEAIVRGSARELSAIAEILEAPEARSLPWTATLKNLDLRDWVVQQR